MGYRMDFVLAGTKTSLISLYIAISVLGWPDALSISRNIFKGIFFSEQVCNSVLKMFSKPCCKYVNRLLTCHPGFEVLFIKEKQCRFNVILFFFNLVFYWRIIALQNFVVFCQTSTWVSHRYTYVPSLWTSSHLPPHPTPLDWYRAPVWVFWATQQIPIGYLFYIW